MKKQKKVELESWIKVLEARIEDLRRYNEDVNNRVWALYKHLNVTYDFVCVPLTAPRTLGAIPNL